MIFRLLPYSTNPFQKGGKGAISFLYDMKRGVEKEGGGEQNETNKE